jgi:SPP1 gp7 family putative phage head morphogenesis protein
MDLDATALNVDRPAVRSVIDEILSKTRGVQPTILDAIGRDIQAGMVEGETIDAITDRVRARMDNVTAHKARTIAQTSVTGGAGQGQQLAYQEAGIGAKSWLSQRDGRVRATHTAADGQEVRSGESFQVGAASLRFPADPLGPAKETIHCRCTTLPVLEEDADLS